MKHPIPKGTFDIVPEDPAKDGAWRASHLWDYVESTLRKLAQAYGFSEIRTPIFERTELFVRGVGESSDIVTKEMYTFEDRGGRLMTLRPEGTAAVMRAVIDKRLDQLPRCRKLFYFGPMMRYERPQAGRYRQHHQFGVEALGEKGPEQDVEVIHLLCTCFEALGLKNLTVHLNSVGDATCREKYKQALLAFFEPHKDILTKESQERLEKNVLRILDTKDEGERKLFDGIPLITDFLSDEASAHFAKVQELLSRLGIDYVVDPMLVRGLDYYTKTVFEVSSGELGAQNAVGAGGRYDNLTKMMGGPKLPAVGFAVGMERLIQTLLAQRCATPKAPSPLLYIVPLGHHAEVEATDILYSLRKQKLPVEIAWHAKKIGSAIEKGVALGAKYLAVLGEDELATKRVKIKELATREETTCDLDKIAQFLLGEE